MKNLLFLAIFAFSITFCSKKVTSSNSINTDKPLETKENLDLKNTKWKLVKLNGNEINSGTKREIGISFSGDGHFSAYAGCNSMGGDFEWNAEKLILKFSKVIATMMVCEDMKLEREFGVMLSQVDNYNLNGNTLKLNKARMAPLAEFELSK